MNEQRKLILEQKTIKYIQDHLAYGSTLGKYLLKSKSLERGEVIAFLPDDVDDNSAQDIWYGGKVPPRGAPIEFVQSDGTRLIAVPVGNMHHRMAEEIEEYLARSTDRLCVLEECQMKPSDPIFPDVDLEIVRVLDEEIYYILSNTRYAKRKEIQALLRKTNPGWHFLGVFTSVPSEDLGVSNGNEIAPEILKELAERTESIILAAYDGEGYLVWNEK